MCLAISRERMTGFLKAFFLTHSAMYDFLPLLLTVVQLCRSNPSSSLNFHQKNPDNNHALSKSSRVLLWCLMVLEKHLWIGLLDVQSEIECVHLDTEHGTSIVAASIDPSPVKYDLMRVWLTNLSPSMLPVSLQLIKLKIKSLISMMGKC